MRFLFLFFFFLIPCLLHAQEKRYTFSQPKLGSYFNLIFYATDSMQATRLAAAAYKMVDSLNQILSDYVPSSELNQLAATAGKDSFVVLSPALHKIFLEAEKAWKITNGNFDVTIGPLSRVWRKARREKVFPAPDSVNKAIRFSGWDKLNFDKKNHRIKLLQKNMQLDLGGIAAGFIAQKVADFLTNKGITAALVDASGDIVCTDAPPGKNGWTIGINRAGEANKLVEKNLELKNCSVSTSGDVYQYLEHEGKKYSHIIDPKTGYGVNFQRNVTVIAKEGTRADWMATALCLIPQKKIKKLAKKMNVSYFITQIANGRMIQYHSRDFRKYWQKTN